MNPLSQRVGPLVDTVLKPFHVSASGQRIVGVVQTCRMVMGLLLVHQNLSVIGLLDVLGPDADLIAWRAGCNLILGALLTLGLFTPLVLAGLVYQYALKSVTGALGDHVSIIVFWGLLFFGAGRQWSLDAWLIRWFPRLGRWLYCLAVDPEASRGLAWARFSLLLLYWGICLAAMIFHWYDPFWRKGHAIYVILTGGYFSAHHGVFRSLVELSPHGFWYLSVLGVVVQSLWELFLVPLMYWRPGRWFVALQGVCFYLVAWLWLQTHYLGLVELVLWGLIFGTGWRLAPVAPVEVARNPLPIRAFALCGTLALVVNLLIYPVIPVPISPERRAVLRQHIAPICKLVAQGQVNVYNHLDMKASTCWMVLHETDARGRHLRVLPYMDHEGGRLVYNRNDLMLYRCSLLWHRVPLTMRFEGGDPQARQTPFSEGVARRIARVDALWTKGQGPRYYRVEVFCRNLREDVHPPRWLPPRHVNGWSFQLEDRDHQPGQWPVYVLNIATWFERQRLESTHDWLVQHSPERKDAQ